MRTCRDAARWLTHARNKRTQVDTRADLCARRWRHAGRKVTSWRAARPRPAWRHPPAAVIWWGAHTNAHAWRLAPGGKSHPSATRADTNVGGFYHGKEPSSHRL